MSPTQTLEDIPAEYLQEGGKKFKIGMDARYRGDLIRSVTGDLTDDMLYTYEKTDALARLEDRDWTKFLPEEFQTKRRGRPKNQTA